VKLRRGVSAAEIARGWSEGRATAARPSSRLPTAKRRPCVALIHEVWAGTVPADYSWERGREAPHRAPEGEGLSEVSSRSAMPKLIPSARGQLSTLALRDAARQKQAEQVQQELDAEKRALEERTAELRARRLARK
jgi:hypothetical protein